MKKIILLIFIVVEIAILQSCQYEWIDPIDAVIPETVSFSADLIPIFDQGCTSCHSTGGTAPDLSAANAYSSLMSGNFVNTATPESSIIYTKVAAGGSMNKYAQPGDDEIILKWIQQGALNN
jgi:hypothetical protein